MLITLKSLQRRPAVEVLSVEKIPTFPTFGIPGSDFVNACGLFRAGSVVEMTGVTAVPITVQAFHFTGCVSPISKLMVRVPLE